MNRCPSREQLHQLLEDQLSEAVRAAVDAHVEGCRACQELLAYLTDDGGEVDTQYLRDSPPESLSGPVAGFVRHLVENPPWAAESAARKGENEEAIAFPGPPTDKGPLGRLASFHIRKQLGAGKFGVVYQAY